MANNNGQNNQLPLHEGSAIHSSLNDSSESLSFHTTSVTGESTDECRNETRDIESNSSVSTGNTTNSLRRMLASNNESSLMDNDNVYDYNERDRINNFTDSIQSINTDHGLNTDENSTLNSNIDELYDENYNSDYVNDSTDEDSIFEEIYEPPNEQIYAKLFDMLQEDSANLTLTANIVVNKIEILLSILKFAFVYSIPNSGVADLCKMFNSFFDERIIPDTRYMIDKLFYPGDNITYHAVCSNCKNYIKTFSKKERFVHCNVCDVNVQLKDPSYHDYFVVLNINKQLKHLIETHQDYYSEVMNREVHINYEDFYDGRMYQNFIQSLPLDERRSYLTVTFNSDGSPVFKSSKFSIWPIQINVNEVPPSVRTKRPLTYALWFGCNKPNMNIFLKPFVEDINNFSQTGIVCDIHNERKTIKIYALCCCVDSVARAPMQGLVQFNGYYGCNWCLHPGSLITHNTGTAIKYTLLNEIPERRSEEGTLNHIQEAVETGHSVYGIKKATPLLLLNKFNIIDGFVPDAMHCIALGIAKQFAEYWFDSSQKPFSISKIDIDRIDNYIKSFKVPTQVARLSRSIKDRKYWKAKEWENWILFYSLPVLQTIHDFERYLKHWSLLVQGFYLLQKNAITEGELLTADQLLREFVAETEYYYTKDAMAFNIHQLSHLSQSVADWGPLWTHSGYIFESGNGKIVRSVHAAKGVVSQVCRNLSMTESILIMEQHLLAKEQSPAREYCFYLENRITRKNFKMGINRYFGRSSLPDASFIQNISEDDRHRYKAYKKLIKNQCVYKSCKNVLQRSNNSFIQTKNLQYVQLIQFVIDTENNREFTLCNIIETENGFDIHTNLQKIVRIQENVSVIETSDIDKLCVWMVIDRKQYISAVPNMYWYS